jgi:signal transduction histidine kinase
MMRLSNLSLRYKLFLGLAIAYSISLLAVYFLTTYFVSEDVKDYIVSENVTLLVELKEQLAEFYASHGNWEGVEKIFEAWVNPGWRKGGSPTRGAMPGRFQWGNDILLADPVGAIIYASSKDLAQGLSPKTLSQGVFVLADGKQVAVLLTGAMMNRFSGLEEDLLASISRSVALTALISLFVVVGVGFFLLRLITAPFGRLIRATKSISSGDLTKPISVKTQDEIGELAQVLDEMRLNLAHSEEMRQHMLADIAHELRNPLAILRAKVEAMLDKIQPTTEENLGSLDDKLEHLSNLIDELQDMALAEAGELPLHVETINLEKFMHEVKADARAILEAESKKFVLDIPSPNIQVCADRRRLMQILWNLLSNALRHTAEGDTISISAEERVDEVLIHVTDTGEGMDEEALSHVFERFYRGKRKKSSNGLGLGLAITKQLVLAHRGNIWVESTLGQGTTFSFSLPVRCL